MVFTVAVRSSLVSRTLIFNQIISNDGNGYDRPCVFTYIFYIAAEEYKSYHQGLDIVINNVSKLGLVGYGTTQYQTENNMVAQNLRRADNVLMNHILAAKGITRITSQCPLLLFYDLEYQE